MKSADYSKMTNEDFDEHFEAIISRMSASSLLAYGDVASILRDVLDSWANANQHLAYPDPEAEKEVRLVGNASEGWAVEVWAQGGRLSRENFGSLPMAEQRKEELEEEFASVLA